MTALQRPGGTADRKCDEGQLCPLSGAGGKKVVVTGLDKFTSEERE